MPTALDRIREIGSKRIAQQRAEMVGIPTISPVLAVQDSQDVQVDVQPLLDVQVAVQDSQDVQKKSKLDAQDVQPPKSRIGRALLTTRQPVQRIEKFDYWCHQHKMDKQAVIGGLLDALMAGHIGLDVLDVQAGQDVWMSKSPLLMIDDEIGYNIISHYEKWTSNKARKSDLEALAELRPIPLGAVKCGVLLSVLRAKGRVNSLRYCVGAARETAASGQQDLEAYLRYLEAKCKRVGRNP